ncbi:tRNA (adenosine(37)-N6)-threonylcarbamoyltransferase complex ATPase subunit type 1 TsaE [Changchengzhania lutea]|uniref:tRNA (adenosine(37)-N6)-threonylcarbamoyltransferase complex ATPase subunit type 1 TsaE n=1 Tax=Changchengzhania lutea TaxID=2049305 RepID=UPI00115EC1F4|nr:tRNA (adenosine(37)-N6)-threonylcarbamoyltransferase complex ATPase subunit type 1 TsaE [Changchengzhania lutea]
MNVRYSLNEVDDVARQLISHLTSKTLLLYGSMGVGKTTLVRALVKQLGSDDAVSSPTFSIVNEYELDHESIYHFDLYRVKDLEEAYNFGIEDYLYSKNWKIIEWPEKIEPILDGNYDAIWLEMDSENKRIITLKQLI